MREWTDFDMGALPVQGDRWMADIDAGRGRFVRISTSQAVLRVAQHEVLILLRVFHSARTPTTVRINVPMGTLPSTARNTQGGYVTSVSAAHPGPHNRIHTAI